MASGSVVVETATAGSDDVKMKVEGECDGTESVTSDPTVSVSSAVATDGSAATATPAAAADATGDDDPAKKQRRIHNIDPQLLLQLEHASSCTVADCAFFNCQRMQFMLKHGATCEQRLAGPCVLCKRIVGLLSAHARQCEKDYAACHVPRCADIRRHFLQQLQQRQGQEQGEQARQAPTPTGATVIAASTEAAGAPVVAPTVAPAAPSQSQSALEPPVIATIAPSDDAAMAGP